LLISRKHFFSEFATFSLGFAGRRATARTTTFVEPCSIQIKKHLEEMRMFSSGKMLPKGPELPQCQGSCELAAFWRSRGSEGVSATRSKAPII